MKVLVVLYSLLAVALCSNCYDKVEKACKSFQDISECNAIYGESLQNNLELVMNYANSHIVRSYQYLLMSTYFGNYQANREGFQKLYRKFSDETWEDAIKLIKYVALRGGEMKVKPLYLKSENGSNNPDRRILGDEVFETTEIASVAKALDIQKILALDAHDIYTTVNGRDPETSSYIEDEYMHKQAKSIRQLAGYANDLSNLLKTDSEKKKDIGVELFLFDEYLQKAL